MIARNDPAARMISRCQELKSRSLRIATAAAMTAGAAVAESELRRSVCPDAMWNAPFIRGVVGFTHYQRISDEPPTSIATPASRQDHSPLQRRMHVLWTCLWL